jgi:hypothetical protein
MIRKMPGVSPSKIGEIARAALVHAFRARPQHMNFTVGSGAGAVALSSVRSRSHFSRVSPVSTPCRDFVTRLPARL